VVHAPSTNSDRLDQECVTRGLWRKGVGRGRLGPAPSFSGGGCHASASLFPSTCLPLLHFTLTSPQTYTYTGNRRHPQPPVYHLLDCACHPLLTLVYAQGDSVLSTRHPCMQSVHLSTMPSVRSSWTVPRGARTRSPPAADSPHGTHANTMHAPCPPSGPPRPCP